MKITRRLGAKEERTREATRINRRWFPNRKVSKKLLMVGGGEIGTEIALAALVDHWKVRAIVSQDKKLWPICNLCLYDESHLDDHYGIKKFDSLLSEDPRPSDRFQYIWVDSFHYTSDAKREELIHGMAKRIGSEKPDVVLLEDTFLIPEDWTSLCNAIKHGVDSRKDTYFLPPIDRISEKSNVATSDVFMKKSVMRKFLRSIVEPRYLLKLEKVDIDAISDNKHPFCDAFRENIRKAVENDGSVVFKLDTTSSGHGQFVLRDISQLETSLKLYRPYENYRTKNKHYVIEKYIENRREECIVRALAEEAKCKCISRICYEKRGLEESVKSRFKGSVRLKSSEIEKGQQEQWKIMEEISKQISESLKVPFIYVEFIIDKSKQQGAEHSILVNEISYRPDDAGFVSRFSHDESQFKLFIDSLQCVIQDKVYPSFTKCKKTKHVKPVADFQCDALNPKSRLDFSRMKGSKKDRKLEIPFPSGEKRKFLLRFYEKDLGEGDEVDYGRIIGYLWHHRSMTIDECLRLLAISERSFEQATGTIGMLRESVSERKL